MRTAVLRDGYGIRRQDGSPLFGGGCMKEACRDIKQKVSGFIDGTLSDRQTAAFIDHIRKCPDCYDELETYFIIDYTLKYLDDAKDRSFNVRQILRDLIRRREHEIRRNAIFRILLPSLWALLILSILILILKTGFPSAFSFLRDWISRGFGVLR
jgi:hypothetical protein